MANPESQAIRANRRAQGIQAAQANAAAASSIDGEDIPSDSEPEVGDDSDSAAAHDHQSDEEQAANDEVNQQAHDNNQAQGNNPILQPNLGDHDSDGGASDEASQQHMPSDDPENDFDVLEEPNQEDEDESGSSSGSESDTKQSDSSDSSNSSDSSSSSGASTSSISSGSASYSDSSDPSEEESISSSEDDTSSKNKRKKKRAGKKAAKREKRKHKLSKKLKGKKKAKQPKGKKRSKRGHKSSKASKRKGEIQIEIGAVPTGELVALQPFWGDQMSDLHTSIPLTVFDQTFARADKEEHNRNHHSSSSKIKSNKGLDAPSEYGLSFGEWSECMSLFRRYLAGYYGQKQLAKRLKLHIENVKSIKRSTECWMTALRYDILCRSQVFVKRDSKTKMKDIGTLMTKYENQAKDKSLRLGEANGGDTNPYAKGGRLEFRHPETGAYSQSSSQQAPTTNSHAGPSTEGQPLKRKRGKRGGHGSNHAAQPQKPFTQPLAHQVQHALPANPMLQQQPFAQPIAAPMAANKFPARGGRGGWRGGRGRFQGTRNEG